MFPDIPAWQAHDQFGVVAIGAVTVLFLIWHFGGQIRHFQFAFRQIWPALTDEQVQMRAVVAQRLAGLLLFGFGSMGAGWWLLRRTPDDYGLNFDELPLSIGWTLLMALLIVPLNYFAARRPDNLAMYPQVRARRWSRALVALSALTWVVYLFGYEYMFRGLLLMGCTESWGEWPAIAINVSIYALVHIPKGYKEAVGAIPLGLLLCLFTLHTGNIWAAFLIHCTMALANEWFSLRFHPDMEVE